jgi:hypothetical protein
VAVMILGTHRYPVYANRLLGGGPHCGESNGSERHSTRVVFALNNK